MARSLSWLVLAIPLSLFVLPLGVGISFTASRERSRGLRRAHAALNSEPQQPAPQRQTAKVRELQFRWKSRAGWLRALQILGRFEAGRYDVSRMSWSWWQDQVDNKQSRVDVTCQECGHRSRGTTLSHLQSGNAPGCFCNRAVLWSSREGHARCLEILRDRYADQYDASRMDWSWWKAHVKDAVSKLDVTCQECGHRSRGTTLSSLQSGNAPGCFCNGAVPWSSREGHARCLEILRDRYADQYDASRMDWSWWKAHVKDAVSKLDVTCQECGHRSRGTTLSSLQSGNAPGCFCNGAVPWSSREGHARCLQILRDRYADQYDASRMDWSWWKAHVKDAVSKLDVTCQECGHRSRGTTLSSLQSGNAPGCFCNGAIPWSSREGHARFLEILRDRYADQHDASRMDWSWWKAHVKDAFSKLDVTCQACGHRSRGTAVGSLQRGAAPGCFCNRAVPWSSREGHARCLQILRDRYADQYDASRMDWSWWKAHVKDAVSKLDVTCQECGHRSRGTSLGNLQSGNAPGCFCNGAVPWSSREGHARFLEILRDRYADQYDASRMDWSWWKAHIKNRCSKLDVTCQACGHRSRGTALSSLQSGNAPGCLCTKKTESKLRQWLAASFLNLTVATQVTGCTSPRTGRVLPFDFGLYKEAVLIELDGDIGHFGRGWGGSANDGGVPQRDFLKEQWAMQEGKVVIRLLQADVYGDRRKWQDFLTSAIQHAIRTPGPCVLTQDVEQYKAGIYQNLRSGMDCETGYFQPSRTPYLVYRSQEQD